MLVNIIGSTSKILSKCNLMIQSSVIYHNCIYKSLKITRLTSGNQTVKLFPYAEHCHSLKSLEVQILL